MIEILTLAATVTKVAGAISSGIKAGRDITSLMPAIGKLGELDAQIQIADSGKHKGIIGKLTSSEQEAYAISSAKMAHKKAMDELRSNMQLFGDYGAWDNFQSELAKQRKRRAEMIKIQLEKRRKLEMMIFCGVGVIIFALGIVVIYKWAIHLRGF